MRMPSISDKHLAYILIIPAVAFLVALTVFPFAFSVVVSFLNWNIGHPEYGIYLVGVKNYVDMLSDYRFLGGLIRSLFYTGTAVSAEYFLGLLFALLLSREFRGRGIVRALFLVPMVGTPIVYGLLWRMLYNPDFGLINYILYSLGLLSSSQFYSGHADWLGNPTFALLSIIIVDIWQWTPFMFLILLAGISSIPTEPLEAAKVDGASAWQTFTHITLPALMPATVVSLLIRTMDVFKDFDKIYIMTGGGPGVASETMNYYAYDVAFNYMNFGYAAAIAFTMSVCVLILSNVYLRFTRMG